MPLSQRMKFRQGSETVSQRLILPVVSTDSAVFGALYQEIPRMPRIIMLIGAVMAAIFKAPAAKNILSKG